VRRFQGKALAALLALVAAACSDPIGGSPTEAAAEYLRARMLQKGLVEGRHWKLVTVRPVDGASDSSIMRVQIEREGQPDRLLFRFSTLEGRWSVVEDVGEVFVRQIWGSQEIFQDMTRRCAEALSRRYVAEVSAEGMVPDRWEIDLDGAVPTARIVIRFEYKQRPAKLKGEFVDIYRYTGGAWKREGNGHLFDIPPPPETR
jgi:hypothetical protein